MIYALILVLKSIFKIYPHNVDIKIDNMHAVMHLHSRNCVYKSWKIRVCNLFPKCISKWILQRVEEIIVVHSFGKCPKYTTIRYKNDILKPLVAQLWILHGIKLMLCVHQIVGQLQHSLASHWLYLDLWIRS